MDTRTREHTKWIGILFLMAATACAEDSASDVSKTPNDSFNNVNNTANNTNNSNDGNNGGQTPEQEFEFARPTVIGNDVFIANESLNTVAVVDSDTLIVRTLPVGFRPTIVAGPTAESTEESRVFVLNEGSESVSVIAPDESQSTYKVLRSTNRLVSGPLGRSAVAWVDPNELSQEERFSGRIDLAAVTLLRDDGAFQISVGFHIRDVRYDEAGDQVFVLTEDGVSVIRPAEVDGDQISPPIAYAPTSEFAAVPRTSLETIVSPDGAYIFTRAAGGTTLVQLEVETREYSVVEFPTQPSDIDLVGDDRLMVNLGDQSLVLIATFPEGIRNAAEASQMMPPVMPDMGMDTDMGSVDMGASTDMGSADMGTADAGMADMAVSDMSNGSAEMGVDSGSADMGPEDMGMGDDFIPFEGEGLEWLEIPIEGLRFGEVDDAGTTAILYRITDTRAVLLNISSSELRGVLFEKPIFFAVPGPEGEAFVIYHRRETESFDPMLTPADPGYIAQSWGISLLDVKSAANRLVLTEFEPGPATIYENEGTRRLYMLFGGLGPNQNRPGLVLTSDLSSFVTDDFDVASPPEEIGTIPGAGRVFVSQRHPQGRLTLVDVEDEDRRQTITGYQLNAGID